MSNPLLASRSSRTQTGVTNCPRDGQPITDHVDAGVQELADVEAEVRAAAASAAHPMSHTSKSGSAGVRLSSAGARMLEDPLTKAHEPSDDPSRVRQR